MVQFDCIADNTTHPDFLDAFEVASMDSQYIAAVIGGACSGSEIAAKLADLGLDVVVFDQNPLPYGKIEDGLPRWHAKLQTKEMRSIDQKFAHPRIHFVPNCKLGQDLLLKDLVEDWGIPLVVMANGAWRDRPLPISGAEKVTDDSFVYQNPFVYWFNHYHEANYDGPTYDVQPGAVVVGGGLASIDVAKICQFELVRAALAEKGHEAAIVSMDHYGVEKVCEGFGVEYASLGIRPARLFYRKRVEDMPLVPLGDNPTADKLAKAEKVRRKLIDNGIKRYGFEVFPLHSPAELVVEDGRVTGMTFDIMKRQDGKFVKTGEVSTVQTPMVISSIGSIPEPIRDVPMDGELYSWENRFTGEVSGYRGVYCVGNAITGRGNIKDSAKNARRLGEVIAASTSGEFDYEQWFAIQKDEARAHVERMIDYLRDIEPMDDAVRERVSLKVASLQQAAGYEGDYAAWRDRILTAR